MVKKANHTTYTNKIVIYIKHVSFQKAVVQDSGKSYEQLPIHSHDYIILDIQEWEF